jgi:hypothetical protein
MDDSGRPTTGAVFDPGREAAAAQVEPAGRLGARDLGVERARLGVGRAALDAEALLAAQRQPGRALAS